MRQKKLTPDSDLALLSVGNAFFQSSLFLILFVFLKDAKAKAFLHGSPLNLVLFPLAALTEIVTALISAINLYQSPNKNYSRVLQFLYDFLKAIAITSAIIGSIVAVTLFQSISPVIFTVVMVTGLMKELGLSIWNLYQILDSKDQSQRKVYIENLKMHSIHTVTAAIFTAAVVLLMLSPAGPAVTFGIAITAASAIGFAAIYGLIQGIPTLKRAKNKFVNACILAVQGLYESHTGPALLAKKEKNIELIELPAVNQEIPQKIRLLSRIKFKIHQLDQQIKDAERNSNRFFSFIETGQRAKREAKIMVLQTYKKMLKEEKTLANLDNIFDEESCKPEDTLFKENLYKHAHQSFWKSQGEVETLSRDFESYLETQATL